MAPLTKTSYKQDPIFDELDRQSKPRFACSCGTMLVFLVALAIVGVAGSLYIVSLVKAKVIHLPTAASMVSPSAVSAKLNRFAESMQQPNILSPGLVISEQELTSILSVAAAKDDRFPVRGTSAKINPRNIVITGTLAKPIKSDIALAIAPKVIDSRLEFEVTKVAAGKLTLPSIALRRVAPYVADFLTKTLNLGDQPKVSTVILQNGFMEIR